MTMYAAKQNAANGEHNRDGHNENLSEDFGVIGPTDDDTVARRRRRRRRQRQRNLLVTTLLAQGTPMLRAGDEIGQSQGGNNNAYCQDNATSWIDWASGDRDLHTFVQHLLALRRALPVARQSKFLHGRPLPGSGLSDVKWLALDGGPVDWEDDAMAGYTLLLRGTMSPSALLVLNRGSAAHRLRLPGPTRIWWRVLDTAQPDLISQPDEGQVDIAPESVTVFIDDAATAKELAP